MQLQIESLKNQYLEFCQYHKKLDPKTLKVYKIDVQQFQDYLNAQKNSSIKETLSNYIKFLNTIYKPKTVKRKIASLKAFFNYLVYENHIEQNPFNKIPTNIKEPVLLPKTIPLSIIEKLLTHAYSIKNDNSLTNHQKKCIIRDIAIIETLFATGIRVSELSHIKPTDIDLLSHSIKIYGKGSRERIIYIENPTIISLLEEYKKQYQEKIEETGFFFINNWGNRCSDQSIRNIIRKHTSQIDCSLDITPHMFRHTFATLLLEGNVDIRYIQNFLGHSSISTTQIYTHLSSSKLKEILANKHPRNKLTF